MVCIERGWNGERNLQPRGGLARVLNGKHRDLLRLEDALLAKGGAGRVIANSRMVAEEITRIYGYPSSKIDIVANGVPVTAFRPNPHSDRQSVRRWA